MCLCNLKWAKKYASHMLPILEPLDWFYLLHVLEKMCSHFNNKSWKTERQCSPRKLMVMAASRTLSRILIINTNIFYWWKYWLPCPHIALHWLSNNALISDWWRWRPPPQRASLSYSGRSTLGPAWLRRSWSLMGRDANWWQSEFSVDTKNLDSLILDWALL